LKLGPFNAKNTDPRVICLVSVETLYDSLYFE
jgi:hypothetical protein